jgi:hypothetical protein
MDIQQDPAFDLCNRRRRKGDHGGQPGQQKLQS